MRVPDSGCWRSTPTLTPTSPAVRDVTAESLANHYEKMVDNLVAKSGLDRKLVYQQTLLTGSCGTGSMEVADAERVFQLTGELSRTLRTRHGL
jgi:hypothetical protein